MCDGDKKSFDLRYEKGAVELYKTIISTQIHFNDLLLRTRWFGTTIVASVLAGSAIALAQAPEKKIPVFSYQLHPAVFLVSFALLMLILINILDKYYYKLLIACVQYGEEYEKTNETSLISLGMGEIGLTQHISNNISRRYARVTVNTYYAIQYLFTVVFIYYIITRYD